MLGAVRVPSWRFSAALSALLLVFLFSASPESDSFGSQRGTAHVSAYVLGIARAQSAVAALGRRFENSVGEAGAVALIQKTCREAGASVRVSSFDSLPVGHSYSSIIEANFPGRREERLIFIVPLDQHQDGPVDEGSGALSLALAEIERLGAEQAAGGTELPVGVSFVFLSAERRGRYAEGEVPGLGSEAWLAENASISAYLAVIYLSFDALPSKISLLNAGKGILSPYWHYENSRRALVGSGFDYELNSNSMQIHRLGFVDAAGPLEPYLSASVPAIELKGIKGAPISAASSFCAFEYFLKNLVMANSGGFSSVWDRDYLSFQVGKRSFVVRETPYIAFLLLFCSAVTAGILVLTIVRRSAAKLFLRRLPVIVGQVFALYCATLVVLFAGRLISGLDALALGSQDFWRLEPRAFLLARILGVFFLFLAALSLLVDRAILTANPYFYEFAALLYLAVDILVFSALMPALAFYFVWAFVFVGFSLMARKPWMSLVSYLLMYAPLLLLARELIVEPELSLYGRLIVPDFTESALLAAALLPIFIFTASPFLFFAPNGKRGRTAAAILLVCLAAFSESGALFRALSPATLSGSPFVLSERLDAGTGELRATLKGSRRIGELSLSRGQSSLLFKSQGDTAMASGLDSATWLHHLEKSSSFLGRSVLRIKLSFTREPDFLSLRLSGDEDLRLYDCSLPYRTAIDGKSAEIFVGALPPQPFELDLTVPRGFEAHLAVKASYNESLVPYVAAEGQSLKSGNFELVDSIALHEEGEK